MSYSVGRFDVECPTCSKPISVLVEGEATRQHVLPGLADKGALTILLGVNQVALDEELARHFAECSGA